MTFIGIVADSENYDYIQSKLVIDEKLKKLRFINLNDNSIENLKNIKFETIAICNDIKKIRTKNILLENILGNIRCLLLNTDINKSVNNFINKNIQIITYGMNKEATVTLSSVREDEILVCLQRNIRNFKRNIIEMQEFKISEDQISNNVINNLLVVFILELLYA